MTPHSTRDTSGILCGALLPRTPLTLREPTAVSFSYFSPWSGNDETKRPLPNKVPGPPIHAKPRDMGLRLGLDRRDCATDHHPETWFPNFCL